MIMCMRLLSVAILVAWQVFPALAHTEWIDLPSLAKNIHVPAYQEDEEQTSNTFFATSPFDQTEIVNARPAPITHLLALIPEAQALVQSSQGIHLSCSFHAAPMGSRACMFRDRGPPIS